MNILLWIKDKDLEAFKKMLNNHLDSEPIMVFRTEQKDCMLTQVSYNAFVGLLDNDKIKIQ